MRPLKEGEDVLNAAMIGLLSSYTIALLVVLVMYILTL